MKLFGSRFIFTFLFCFIQFKFTFCTSVQITSDGSFHETEREEHLLKGLHASVKSLTEDVHSTKRISLGFGACVDGIVPAVQLMNALGIDPYTITPKHHHKIDDLTELAELFTFFFIQGAAAERYVADADLWGTMVEKTRGINDTWTLGGNAAMMANRMAHEGVENILLGALTTSHIKNQLHSAIQTFTANQSFGHDVHIILEYLTNETWGPFRSPRANRLALHRDVGNAEIQSLEYFIQQVSVFRPTIFVLGGLQLMQEYPFPNAKIDPENDKIHPSEQRLKDVDAFLKTLDKSIPVHFEFASISDITFMETIDRTIIPHTDSIGCNEQELGILFGFYTSGAISYVQNSKPRVADVLDQLYVLFDILRHRGLSRIHVHTLAHQTIIRSLDSEFWKNNKASAARASLMAVEWVCGGDVTVESTYIILDDSFKNGTNEGSKRIQINDDEPVTCWISEELNAEICVAPNLVCLHPKQTIGAGDNISGAGLVYA